MILRRAGVVGVLVFVLGLTGAVLLIAAERSVIYEVEVVTASCEDLASADLRDQCVTKGYEQHSNALMLLGLVGIFLAVGAGLGRVRIAAAALIVIGAVTLAIALLGDLPDTDETGEIGINFDRAEAKAGIGLTLEIIGGAVCIAAGALGLRRDRRPRRG